jgi:uncharacterized protein YutE (UPF0331/DUF86 family)
MVDRSIVTAKVAQIEKCLIRIRERRPTTLQLFLDDADRQDIVMFNLMQALQGCIDLAAHVVSDEGFGMAGSMNEFFYLLQEQGIIPGELTERMVRAVGFRNLCAHEYARLDLEKVYEVSLRGLEDIEAFLKVMVQRYI